MQGDKSELGFMVFVLRHAEFGDCTNGGPSSRFSRAILFDDALPKMSAVGHGYFPLCLVRHGNGYIHAEPFNVGSFNEESGKPGRHKMFGGNFIYTSDSRLRKICDYPIPIHDRVE